MRSIVRVRRRAAGMAAALGLLAVSGLASAAVYRCTGTEPFWSLNVGPRTIVWSGSDAGRHVFRLTRPQAPRGTTLDFVSVYRTRSVGRPARNMTVIIRQDSGCSDGMSDTAYSHSVTILMPGEVYEGCCHKR